MCSPIYEKNPCMNTIEIYHWKLKETSFVSKYFFLLQEETDVRNMASTYTIFAN